MIDPNNPHDVEKVRRRVEHYISPEVAGCASLTVFDLEQFVAGAYTPDATQLRLLANRMRMS